MVQIVIGHIKKGNSVSEFSNVIEFFWGVVKTECILKKVDWIIKYEKSEHENWRLNHCTERQ